MIDPYQQWLRQLVAQGDRFGESTIKEGQILSKTLEGFWIELDWLWEAPSRSILQGLELIQKHSR